MKSLKKYPLSPVQQQFWLQYQQDPDGSAYNMASLFEISGGFDPDAAEQALKISVQRYDELRASFVMGDTRPEQVISDFVLFEFPLKEFSQQQLEDDINASFDIELGPLFRFVLYKKEEQYILLFVFHHLVIDLRSKDLFGQEFSYIYNSYSKGESPDLIEIDPYEKYVDWYSTFSVGEKYKQMLSFWNNQSLLSEPLNISCDYERHIVTGTEGSRIKSLLSAEISMELMGYCEKENSSPFLVLLSAYFLFLHKYSGQERLSVGVPRTNRYEDDFENIFGCFMNILPMVIEISDDLSFSGLLEQVRRQMLLIHRNQYVPYLEVLKTVREAVDRKYNPLFQAGFTNEYPMELNLEGLNVEPLSVPGHGSQLDFFFYFWKRNDIFYFEWEYNSSLFKKERIELFVSSFKTILKQIIKGDDFILKETQWLADVWRQKVCFEWNRTDEAPVGFKGVHSLFEEKVKEFPERTALRFRGQSLSYVELNRRANVLAFELKRLGAGIETIVGLSLERSFGMVIAMLGILKIGASYMPMEPTHPDEYKKYLVEDTGLSILITTECFRDKLTELFSELTILCLDDKTLINESFPENPSVQVNSSTRAYLFYSSGSTGKPKGIEVEHGGLTDRILWMDRTFHFGQQRNTLLKTPYNFDVSGMEFWLPLVTGAPLVIAEPEGHLDNAYLVDIVQKENISIIHFVPSLLGVFLNTADSNTCGMIKDVFCCGETLPSAVVNDFYKKFPDSRLHNLYGPTEATIFITYWPCRKNCSIVPIGKPVSDAQVYVLDESLNPVPPGVLGDLYLSGSGLARGYYNRKELTEKMFVEHFLDESKRMYKSGDLAMWAMDGNINYFGRSDNQVQLHGQRIELGEIESILNNHPGVKTSAVIVDGDFGAEQRLVAYVVREDLSLNIESIKSHILVSLPKYMLPSLFFFPEELPLSSNGKLDRKKLPHDLLPEIKYTVGEDKIKGKLENQIAEIWRAVLNVPIRLHDNFFDLGGTSLQIMEMHRALGKLLDEAIPVTMLFRYTTVGSLAAYIQKEGKGGARDKILSRAEKQRQIRKRKV